MTKPRFSSFAQKVVLQSFFYIKNFKNDATKFHKSVLN